MRLSTISNSITPLLEAHRELIIRLLTLIGSFASVLALALPYLPPVGKLPWWGVALGVMTLFFVLLLLWLELRSERRRSVYRAGDSKGIQKYMHRWISHGGRVAVWTRDMSWANTEATRQLLLKKAAAGELIICLPQETKLTKELESSGAEVSRYSALGSEPACRFTIVRYGQEGSAVAVGRRRGNYHVIDEFSAEGHPAFYLARDLVRFARGVCGNQGES
jgi:hypothetical protein